MQIKHSWKTFQRYLDQRQKWIYLCFSGRWVLSWLTRKRKSQILPVVSPLLVLLPSCSDLFTFFLFLPTLDRQLTKQGLGLSPTEYLWGEREKKRLWSFIMLLQNSRIFLHCKILIGASAQHTQIKYWDLKKKKEKCRAPAFQTSWVNWHCRKQRWVRLISFAN